MTRETNLIPATEFPPKNRILPEAPAVDGNIIGDRNTLRTCRAKCSNVAWAWTGTGQPRNGVTVQSSPQTDWQALRFGLGCIGISPQLYREGNLHTIGLGAAKAKITEAIPPLHV